ncbi:MAG: calcium-translocating P-type ATPase, PMCA-type [bacterium]|nr:calcium-translocating P-type ATPase, PMCA-type [bacterium]
MGDKMYNGLTEKEVIDNRKKYGTNDVSKAKTNSFFSLLIDTLADPIIKILLIALAIKTIFLFKNFDWYETIGIVIAILFASLISTISEYGSEKSFQKLQDEVSKVKCKVIRNGKKIEIPMNDVVVDDIVSLETGDKIPADGIIVKGNISVDESSLNGESSEAYKESVISNNIIKDKNRVYKGSVVYSNSALMKVTSVGENTFYGKIALELQEKKPETPLKLKLRSLAGFISKIGYIGAFLVFFSYLFKVVVINNNFDIELIRQMVTNFPLITGHILYALTLCVTIIIVAVPEGLPMMITLVLSSNMKRMLKDNVLVRKLVGIETSGNINILFTDKTGTLTKGKLELKKIISGSLNEYKNEVELAKKNKYYNIVKLSCIGNNSSSYDDNKIIGGNITDRSILKFFKNDNIKIKKQKEIPFDSKNKYSITRIDDVNYIKGAPEMLLNKCVNYYDEFGTLKKIESISKLQSKINTNTKNGIRVLVLATSFGSIESISNLNFVGILLIKDDIRKEAKEGVKLVKGAHIKTIMITGDNKDTAISIGREVGIYEEGDLVLTSEELNKLTDDELKSKLMNISIVARSLPTDKSRLVRISQELDLVVGMTGDGVNDAPALKKADVGFSMGSGTEVSKEASDIVILDDNFMSISKAILFGRTIFKSIRKFIIVQLTINMCALSLSIIGPFINIEMPITVIQMLWINMVMDTLAGLAFSFEPPIIEYMSEYPNKKDTPIINKYMLNQIFFTGIYSSLICILFLKLPFIKQLFRADKYLYTAFFGLFIFIDIFNSFNARTNKLNLLSNILKNKVFIFIMLFIVTIQILLIYYGGELFRTSGLSIFEFEIMILFAFSVIPFDWIRKLVLNKKGKNTGV